LFQSPNSYVANLQTLKQTSNNSCNESEIKPVPGFMSCTAYCNLKLLYVTRVCMLWCDVGVVSYFRAVWIAVRIQLNTSTLLCRRNQILRENTDNKNTNKNNNNNSSSNSSSSSNNSSNSTTQPYQKQRQQQITDTKQRTKLTK